MPIACRAVAISHSAAAPTTRTASATVLPLINPITAAISATWLSMIATQPRSSADPY